MICICSESNVRTNLQIRKNDFHHLNMLQNVNLSLKPLNYTAMWMLTPNNR